MRDAIARRSDTPCSTLLRRGSAVLAVTGGAFSLVAAESPAATPVNAGTSVVTVARSSPFPAQVGPTLQSSVQPVAIEPAVVDAGELVKAVQLAEQEVARIAAEEQAAKVHAAAEKEAAETAETKAAVTKAPVTKAAEIKAAETKAAETKAAQITAAQITAAAERIVVGSPDCGMSTSGLGAVKAHVRSAAEFLGCLFGEPRMIGVAGRAGASDHPRGLAVDFMVDRSTGDALAACALRNKAALGITYVIWRQRIDTGSGWKAMADRGDATANHMDHVHISFASGAGNGRTSGC